jgi:group I intron endonuclease
MICIYKITTPSNRIYIGKTVNYRKRLNSYKSLHCKTQPLIYRSLLKYGADKCKFEIIEVLENINNIFKREKYWINKYDTYHYDNIRGLNLTKGGDGINFISDKHKQRIIESNSTRIISKETRNKMSIKSKGKFVSQETRLKISKTNKGIKRNYTRIVTNDLKLKLSLNSKRNKEVIDTETGRIFINISQASKYFNLNRNTLKNYLNGKRTNKTTLKYK